MTSEGPNPEVVVRYSRLTKPDGYYIHVRMLGKVVAEAEIGPFDTELEFERALEDMLEMGRQTGGQDIPGVRN